MEPNFFIIGAQKSGTSWLGKMLSQHTDIYIYPKEIHFFDKEGNYSKGLDWYLRHFDGRSEKIIGEKTPDYYWTASWGDEGHRGNAYKDLAKSFPQAKFCLVLRDPVQRAISAATHIIRSGRTHPHHSAYDIFFGKQSEFFKKHGVIDYGFYYKHISKILEAINPVNIQILIFEKDIVQNPENGLCKVCNFLGVHDFGFSDINEKINAHRLSKLSLILNYKFSFLPARFFFWDNFLPAYKIPVSKKDKQQLYDVYKDENRRLFDFLGYDIPEWDYEAQTKE